MIPSPYSRRMLSSGSSYLHLVLPTAQSTTATMAFRATLSLRNKLGTVVPLGAKWKGVGPFVLLNHHVDHYPPGTATLGPDPKLLKGHNLGWDFENEYGWRAYMATGPVPGFPAHPHRGFETVSLMRKGFMDHGDSTGAGARYGNGDVQWVTAGSGVRHSEMIPLLDDQGPNEWEMYQLWLNLPKKKKFCPPEFRMLWAEDIPIIVKDDGRVKVTVMAGEYEGRVPPPAPSNSWANEPGSDLAIWLLDLKTGGKVTIPAPNGADTLRTLYVHGKGARVRIGEQEVKENEAFEASPGNSAEHAIPVTAEADSTILLLQARDIGEPVVIKGPFVMNTEDEIKQAYADYKKGHFGWDEKWSTSAPVYPKDAGRFAYFGDRKVYPPGQPQQ